MIGTVSAGVESYAAAAIGTGTRNSYNVAYRHWEAYCRERGWSIWAEITTPRLCDWLAAMADRGTVCANTIKVYRSAMSTWHTERAGPNAAATNPAEHPYVARLITGITRAKAPLEQAKREQAPANTLSLDWIIRVVVPRHPQSNPRLARLLAALCLGTAGALRPSEFLGSALHPDRAPTRSQLRFFDGSAEHVGERTPREGEAVPEQARFVLHVAKTDQVRRGTHKVIAAPFAVAALWRWCLAHGPWSCGSIPLFELEGKLLLPAQLREHLVAELTATGQVAEGVTLKGARRTAASTLLAAGASPAEIQVAGHWKAISSQQHYFSTEARRAAAARVNKSLELPPAAAASSSSL